MRFFIFLLLVFNFSVAQDLKYIGSSTIGKTFFPELAKIFEKKSSHRFTEIKSPGSGKGAAAIIAGETSLAGMSRAIKLSERQKGLRFFAIGYDAIGVIVNKDNPITSLSMPQIADIFSGKITNWKEVGGEDMPIKVAVENLGEKRATQVVFTEIVLETKQLIGTYAPDAMELDMPLDEVKYVAQNKGAIAAVSMSFISEDNDIKTLLLDGVKPDPQSIANGSYAISRPLVLLTKKEPPAAVQEFLYFVFSREAQDIIAKKFVAAR